MDFAVNYHRWILERMRPFLGKHIVEVGAGAGSLSTLLLETRPQTLTALEPSANMYPLLLRKLTAIGNGRVTARQCTLVQACGGPARSLQKTDSIVYINVLEHIEDDAAELLAAHSALKPGGRVLIFAPAHRWLMGKLDRRVGHFRRYSINELTGKCRAAGFTIRLATHFDLLGIAPWWVKYRLFKSDSVEAGAVRLYDRCVVPIARIFERAINPPVGKNLIVVGEKSA